jgi:predicted site-specific integrase-resolvase
MSKVKYYKLSEAANLAGLSKQTIYGYAMNNKIKFITTPGGQKLYDISTIINEPVVVDSTDKHVCYCRVSTHGQADDLERQIAYMRDKYPDFEMIHDIGSGINFKRPGLQKIIDYAIKGKLKRLVIAYKDRLCRIGYELIEHILTTYSNTEIIVDSAHEETINEEIANDILQIITVYSAKINGMRHYDTNTT